MFVALMAAGAAIAFAIGWSSFEATVVLLLTYGVIVLAQISARVGRLSNLRAATSRSKVP